jgi:hypothetical protein
MVAPVVAYETVDWSNSIFGLLRNPAPSFVDCPNPLPVMYLPVSTETRRT